MADITGKIQQLFSGFSHRNVSSIQKLPKSGSNREYYRINTEEGDNEVSFIATYNPNVEENQAFIFLARHFHELQLPVPVIYTVSGDNTIYIQEDLGGISLLDARTQDGDHDTVYQLYKKSLRELAGMQFIGGKGLDYSFSQGSGVFGREAVLHDLLYFKFYFLDALSITYNREKLLLELEMLAGRLSSTAYSYFMFRDFQGRNIMVRGGDVTFIDFQGGMKGPMVYDAASLLWQAKAQLSNSWRDSLFTYYMNCVEEITGNELNREMFREEYNGFVLLRLLQVLGAYGFRGLFERKQHFLSSIPQALENLADFKKQFGIPALYPELNHVVNKLISGDVKKRFTATVATENSPLVVKINSFSFTQRGYPPDNSGNGGGFVFDCRGIMNPGRIDEFKPMTGRDDAVKIYLEENTRMPQFLERVYETVDIAVENYLERGFENLVVSFGCTGGRHRSVYAADALAKHLKDKYNVKTVVSHMEQEFKN